MEPFSDRLRDVKSWPPTQPRRRILMIEILALFFMYANGRQ